MKTFVPFYSSYDPLEAEALIDILQKHNIPFERTFEKSDDLDDYIGSHPFDMKIVISINKADFSKVESLLKQE